MKKVLKRIDGSFFEWNKSVKMKYISHCGPVTYGPRTCSGRGPGVGEPCTKSQNWFYKNKKNILVFNWFNWTWWTKYKRFTLWIFFFFLFFKGESPSCFFHNWRTSALPLQSGTFFDFDSVGRWTPCWKKSKIEPEHTRQVDRNWWITHFYRERAAVTPVINGGNGDENYLKESWSRQSE